MNNVKECLEFLQVNIDDIDMCLLCTLKEKIESKPATEKSVEMIEQSLINDLEEVC